MDNPKVFIIEIWFHSDGWVGSIDFPNFYTESEADAIIAGNSSLGYRKREIDYV